MINYGAILVVDRRDSSEKTVSIGRFPDSPRGSSIEYKITLINGIESTWLLIFIFYEIKI